MWRTIKYSIWPREIRFEDGLLDIVEFAKKRNLAPGSGKVLFDNIFQIAITELEGVRCDNLDEFIEVMRRTPLFNSFQCNPFFKINKQDKFLRTGISFNHHRVEVAAASSDVDLVEATHRFIRETFNLRNPEIPSSPDDRPKYLHPTVFIGRHFDDFGDNYYSKLSSFLDLLGFEVKQGEEYTSQAIPEKVKSRIDTQDIFICIVNGDREHSWLIAESSYALGKGKHVILLVENQASYSHTILGQDLEMVPFERGHIEQSFIPLLQELRSVRVRGI